MLIWKISVYFNAEKFDYHIQADSQYFNFKIVFS